MMTADSGRTSHPAHDTSAARGTATRIMASRMLSLPASTPQIVQGFALRNSAMNRSNTCSQGVHDVVIRADHREAVVIIGAEIVAAHGKGRRAAEKRAFRRAELGVEIERGGIGARLDAVGALVDADFELDLLKGKYAHGEAVVDDVRLSRAV